MCHVDNRKLVCLTWYELDILGEWKLQLRNTSILLACEHFIILWKYILIFYASQIYYLFSLLSKFFWVYSFYFFQKTLQSSNSCLKHISNSISWYEMGAKVYSFLLRYPGIYMGGKWYCFHYYSIDIVCFNEDHITEHALTLMSWYCLSCSSFILCSR